MVNETIKIEFKERMRELRFGIGPSRILCEDRGISFSDMHEITINELIQDGMIWFLIMVPKYLRRTGKVD